ncbi:MAG TPA: hypothetical protein VM692_11025, partial [Gammaproteobacteria bacterium]|nr:hypothetical protein [Gammaproteobacteria bacterium]
MTRRITTAVVAALLCWPLLVVAAPHAVETAAPVPIERPDKPTGPIVVEHRLLARPAVGVPLRIAVTARVEGDVGRLSIEANATSPSSVVVSPAVPVASTDGVYAWEITVVPLTPDAGYLSVIVSGSIDGVAQARSVTVALRSAVPTEPAAVTVVEGETLIALPVQ